MQNSKEIFFDLRNLAANEPCEFSMKNLLPLFLDRMETGGLSLLFRANWVCPIALFFSWAKDG